MAFSSLYEFSFHCSLFIRILSIQVLYEHFFSSCEPELLYWREIQLSILQYHAHCCDFHIVLVLIVNPCVLNENAGVRERVGSLSCDGVSGLRRALRPHREEQILLWERSCRDALRVGQNRPVLAFLWSVFPVLLKYYQVGFYFSRTNILPYISSAPKRLLHIVDLE